MLARLNYIILHWIYINQDYIWLILILISSKKITCAIVRIWNTRSLDISNPWKKRNDWKNKCREFIRFWIHVHVENVRVCKYVYMSYYGQYLIILWECFNSVFFIKWDFNFIYIIKRILGLGILLIKNIYFNLGLNSKNILVIIYMYLLFLQRRSI